MIPGSNLLSEALELIASQPVKYYRNNGRVANAALILVPTYDPVQVVRRCSVQAVPRTRYEVLGLDMSKSYVTWFAPQAVITIDRDKAGDKIVWNGASYQCETVTDWSGQDGWSAVICVKIGGEDA